MKNLLRILAIMFLNALFTNCSILTHIAGKKSFQPYPPSLASIEISHNLYMDYTEISNLNWLEYMYWTKRVIGSESPEYLSTLPDTTVWLYGDSCEHPFVSTHYRAYKFKNYPIVGITYDQALEFTKWRTDRVLESILLKQNLIEPKTYVTVERFLSGKILFRDSTKSITHIPIFRLPTPTDWQKANTHNDSIVKQLKTRKWQFLSQHKNYANPLLTYTDFCNKDSIRNTFLNKIPHSEFRGIPLILEMNGSVNELSNIRDIYLDSIRSENALNNLLNDLIVPSRTIGFRNVCEWVEINP